MAFEVVEFREPAPVPGTPYPGRQETILGRYESELAAIEHARTAWRLGCEAVDGDVAWWIVRVPPNIIRLQLLLSTLLA